MQDYPKLSQTYYVLLECLAQDHMSFLSTLEPQVFLYILSSISEGLTALGGQLNHYTGLYGSGTQHYKTLSLLKTLQSCHFKICWQSFVKNQTRVAINTWTWVYLGLDCSFVCLFYFMVFVFLKNCLGLQLSCLWLYKAHIVNQIRARVFFQ